MAEVTTNFRDSNNGDLGKNLVSKEYLQSVYPKLASSLFTGNLFGSTNTTSHWQGNNDSLGSAVTTRPIYTTSPQSDWVHVAINYTPNFSIAINSDGSLWYCGRITPINGSLGTYISIPQRFGTLSNWKYANTGERNSFLVNSDNTLTIRGEDNYGQLAANYSSYKWKAATDLSSTAGNYVTICAIKTDGTLWSWGCNDGYGLGTGNYIPFSDIPISPHSTSSISIEHTQTNQWKKCCISSGTAPDLTTVLALKNDGSLWCWGNNDSTSDVNLITRQYSRLTPIPYPYGNTNWLTIPTTISAMDPTSYPTVSVGSHVNYIKNDGTLWCWGDNRSGSYARGDFSSVRPYSPRREYTSSTNWKIVDATSSTLEPRYFMGLKTDGTAWFWGQNYNSSFFAGNTYGASPRLYASQLPFSWKQVSVDQNYGSYSSGIVLLRNDNTIWQHNNSYLLYQLPIRDMSGFTPAQELTLSTNWQSLSAGRGHVAAIKTNGTLWSWGGSGSGSGRLGNNTNNSSSIAVQEATSSTNWKQVSCVQYSTVALKTDGTVWGWGNLYNWYGSGNITRSSPVQEFSSSTNWRLIQGCSYANKTYYVGIKQDGTLWSWGDNSDGQLGNNSQIFAAAPVQEWSSSTNWNYVLRSAGTTTAAVKNDGTLWLWGDNRHSQLGIESGTYLITPTEVYTNSKWIDMSAVKGVSASKYVGIKQNGTLWTWGTSTPMQQIGLGRSWKTCTAGSSFQRINALATDGSLLTGGTDYIQLAKGSSNLSWAGIKIT